MNGTNMFALSAFATASILAGGQAGASVFNCGAACGVGLAAGGGFSHRAEAGEGTQIFSAAAIAPGVFAQQVNGSSDGGSRLRAQASPGVNKAQVFSADDSQWADGVSRAYAAAYWGDSFTVSGGKLGEKVVVFFDTAVDAEMADSETKLTLSPYADIDELGAVDAANAGAGFRMRQFWQKEPGQDEMPNLSTTLFNQDGEDFWYEYGDQPYQEATGLPLYDQSPVLGGFDEATFVQEVYDDDTFTVEYTAVSPSTVKQSIYDLGISQGAAPQVGEFIDPVLSGFYVEIGKPFLYGQLLEVWARSGGYADAYNTARVTGITITGAALEPGQTLTLTSESGFDYAGAIGVTYNGQQIGSGPATTAPVPLPAAAPLMLSGLVALGLLRRRG